MTVEVRGRCDGDHLWRWRGASHAESAE